MYISKKKVLIIISVILTVILIAGGIYAYSILNKDPIIGTWKDEKAVMIISDDYSFDFKVTFSDGSVLHATGLCEEYSDVEKFDHYYFCDALWDNGEVVPNKKLMMGSGFINDNTKEMGLIVGILNNGEETVDDSSTSSLVLKKSKR